MKSLFNAADNQGLVDRINALTAASKPLWGKMQVAQMLAHAQQPLRVSLGELHLKRGVVGFLFGKIAKKQLLAGALMKKNLPTAREFLVKTDVLFEEEKKKLIALVQRFYQNGPNGLTKEDHPFFGKLTSDEWDKLQYIHLDHHLRQFGV